MNLTPCRACGAPCDGDVCDTRCADAAESRRIDREIAAGRMDACFSCGEPHVIAELNADKRCEGCAEAHDERVFDNRNSGCAQ